jgi:hypothetical protein
MTDPILRARRLPTSAELADRLGVPEYDCGPLYAPAGATPGHVDMVLDRQLWRFTVLLDAESDWPARPSRKVVVRVPESVRRAREAKEHLAAETARRGEVERRHYAALRRLAAGVVASTQARHAVPVWLVAAQAVDRERRRHGITTPSAVTAAALGLDDRPGPTRDGGRVYAPVSGGAPCFACRRCRCRDAS